MNDNIKIRDLKTLVSKCTFVFIITLAQKIKSQYLNMIAVFISEILGAWSVESLDFHFPFKNYQAYHSSIKNMALKHIIY